MISGNSSKVQELQLKLNSTEFMPRMAFRRNVVIYELVSYVNHATGCYLSRNWKVLSLFIERANIFIEEHPANEDSMKYYELVDSSTF